MMDAARVNAVGLEGSLAPPYKGWSVNILPVRSTARLNGGIRRFNIN